MKRSNYSVLEYAGARRVKRTWVRTAVTLLVLFLLSMLTGWLVSCVRHAARGEEHGAWSMGHGMSPSLQVSESPLLAGVPDWLAVGIVVLLVALLLARWVWGVVVGGDEAEGDPLAETAVGLVPEEVGRIVDACRREAREGMVLIEAALKGDHWLPEDAEDAMRDAKRKIEQVVKTLGELQRGVNASAQCSVLSGECPAKVSPTKIGPPPPPKPVLSDEAWPFCQACESWHSTGLKCVGSVEAGELEQEITEGTEKTANVDEWGLCSRCHGRVISNLCSCGMAHSTFKVSPSLPVSESLGGPRGVDWTNGDLTNAWDADKSVRAPLSESPLLQVSESSTKGGQGV